MLRIHDDVRDPPSLGRQLAGACLLCLFLIGVTVTPTLESAATPPRDTTVAVTYPSHPSEFCRTKARCQSRMAPLGGGRHE